METISLQKSGVVYSQKQTSNRKTIHNFVSKVISFVLFVLIVSYPICRIGQQKLQEVDVYTPLFEQDFFVLRNDFQMDLAGEIVPVHIEKVKYRYLHELNIYKRWKKSTNTLRKRAVMWLPVFEEVLKKNQVPLDFKYVAVVESGLQNNVSRRGAAGFWQLLPAAAREFGLEVNEEVDERFHPIKSTEAACRYFKRMYKHFNNSWSNALASYNIGLGALGRQLKKQKKSSYYDLTLNNETSRYVFKVLAFKEIMEKPKKHGFQEMKRIYPKKVKTITVKETINDLKAFAEAQGVDAYTFFEHNPWLLTNTLTIKEEGKTYQLVLPIM